MDTEKIKKELSYAMFLHFIKVAIKEDIYSTRENISGMAKM